MFDVEVNLSAVLVATFTSMAVGALWYSPVLLGKQWMKAVGKKEADLKKGAASNATTGYVIAAVLGLVTAYVLAHIVQFIGAASLKDGLLTGVWVWVGFVAPTSFINLVFADKSTDLWVIEAGHHLASLAVMGAVLGLMQ